MRVLADELLGRLEVDPAQQVEHGLLEVVAAQAVDDQRPAEDVAHVVHRVERGERVLQHQLDGVPVGGVGLLVQVDLLAVEEQLAGGQRLGAGQHPRQRRLAGAALADDGGDRARAQGDRDVLGGVHDAAAEPADLDRVVLGHVDGFEQRLGLEPGRGRVGRAVVPTVSDMLSPFLAGAAGAQRGAVGAHARPRLDGAGGRWRLRRARAAPRARRPAASTAPGGCRRVVQLEGRRDLWWCRSSMAHAQRGWNGQPRGTLRRSGGEPSMPAMTFFSPCSEGKDVVRP